MMYVLPTPVAAVNNASERRGLPSTLEMRADLESDALQRLAVRLAAVPAAQLIASIRSRSKGSSVTMALSPCRRPWTDWSRSTAASQRGRRYSARIEAGILRTTDPLRRSRSAPRVSGSTAVPHSVNSSSSGSASTSSRATSALTKPSTTANR